MTQKKMNFDKFIIKPKEGSNIKKTIAIMSGKGGVGKSSVTSMLAAKLSKDGNKVAILDADITGPSIPQAFGIKESVRSLEDGTLIAPESKSGIKIMSINLVLQDKSAPVVWRSSIVNNVLKQFYTDVDWGEIDYLLIDMPPGTSDIPLTVFQSLNIDGAIAVTTPQDLVGMVVEKSLNMAKMMGKEILGIVENMSYFKAKDTGNIYKIFGEGKTDEIAEKFKIDTVAKLAINPEITSLIDQGKIEEVEESDLDKLVEKIEKL
ncbi:Mrp/NBP35 family ATP-binding protein [Anaerococcus obesiensis]|uniref:Iron-sulfur cluster carrier protein n=1 Tax=Anaerococcus obesiensis TaxID=1287640 RepID=A0A7T7ZV88_9FIRM|nr:MULTISPECIES: Mrp/NBP35 family ATP-binding protein [Anaerococcus]MDU0945903.1 Mrp/NBP35 family ATP-binding protein [Anaerococcus vaginalis]MDU1031125.1 Mrp/NBP35 family ATP-binding protein [Anaerococcus vaginalis]MDU2376283.1 Mrp/NBP35 family ATP-binding protein [Anaerococcus vaginalis]MDU2649698.1 Mrp/NBP35 family ATP-binding protein [Anaerococcus vaginalis]MDU5086471.1 Mrp/NBP35 family ATP-binding protein [Anaerococcus vaginalis]